MPDIKTRDVVSGTIKAVDRSAMAGQRIKDIYVKAKDGAEHSVYSSECNSEEHAADKITDSVSELAQEAIHQAGVHGRRIIQEIRRPDEPPKTMPDAQPRQENPHQSSNVPQQRNNVTNAQQPHRVIPGGAVSHNSGGHSEINPDAPTAVKQEAVRNQQIKTAKSELKVKRASWPVTSTVPQPYSTVSTHTSQAVNRTEGAVRQTAKSFEKIAVKIPERTIKTAGSTVKTVEHMGGTAIKSTQAAAKAAQKTAVIAAQTAHRSRVAARAAAVIAKKTAEYTARAAKAIAQAMQELISVAATGGGTIMVLIIVLIVMCFAGMMLASDKNDTEILPVSEEVKAYEPIIQKYAKEHGIGDYVLLSEAVMMQESGGRGTDPMQCAECKFNTLYPHTPGSITEPEYSINVGIQNLADCLQIAECESPVDINAIKLALQGYNYGQSYITWAMSKYGEYTKTNAIEFSLKTAEQCGWVSYGDMDYVPHVLRYYPLGQIFYAPDISNLIVEVARSQIGNVGGELYWRWYGFNERVEWCACFVSWCANQCGYIDAGTIPKFSGCQWGVSWFKQHGQWINNRITPTPGMIIFFDWDGNGMSDHTGIVEKVENGRVYTIEGNTADSCRERSYPLGDYEILGYGVLCP